MSKSAERRTSHSCQARTRGTIVLTNGYVAIIDAEDFERVNQFKWFAKSKKAGGDDVYAARSQREDKKIKTIYLHRFIMNCPAGKEVDNKDTDRLNCRRSNLEIVTRQENMRRRWRK